MWHRALSRLLLRFPQPQLTRRLPKLTVEELKHEVLQAARLDRLWHALDYHPRLIRSVHRDRNVEHVSLVAGGNWLIVVLYDGSLELQELGAQTPAATLPPSLTEDESVIYLSSFVSLTNDHEDILILQMGVRYKCVYSSHSLMMTHAKPCRTVNVISTSTVSPSLIHLPPSCSSERYLLLAPCGAALPAGSSSSTGSKAEAET